MKIYDANKNVMYSLPAHINIIQHIKLLSDGNLVSCSTDNKIKLWNPTTGSLVKIFSGHTDTVFQVDQIDSDTIVSGSFDYTIRFWKISSGSEIKNYSTTKPIYSLKLLTNGFLAIGFQAGINNLQLFNWTMGKFVTNLVGHTNIVFSIEILDSQYIASASADKNVMVWDLVNNGSLKYTLSGHVDQVVGLKLLSSTLLASGSYDTKIRIWNWQIGSLVRILDGHTNSIWLSLDIFSENVLISGSFDSTIKFWNITSGSLIQSLSSTIPIGTLKMLCPCKLFFQIKSSIELNIQ